MVLNNFVSLYITRLGYCNRALQIVDFRLLSR